MGYTPRPYGEVAGETFANLCALAGDRAEREELLAAGVAPSTVDTLYPISYAAILPGLLAHYELHPAAVRYGESHQSLMKVKTGNFLNLRQSGTNEIAIRWLEEIYALQVSPEHEAFEAELIEKQTCEVKVARYFITTYRNLLLDAWWAMANRSLLDSQQQDWADDLFSLASWDLFPHLRPHSS